MLALRRSEVAGHLARLDIACAEVVQNGEAEDVVERILRQDVSAAAANDDPELELIVHALRVRRPGDLIVGAHERLHTSHVGHRQLVEDVRWHVPQTLAGVDEVLLEGHEVAVCRHVDRQEEPLGLDGCIAARVVGGARQCLGEFVPELQRASECARDQCPGNSCGGRRRRTAPLATQPLDDTDVVPTVAARDHDPRLRAVRRPVFDPSNSHCGREKQATTVATVYSWRQVRKTTNLTRGGQPPWL